jgi:threonine/homoserine/homoserine lactone efflux protein
MKNRKFIIYSCAIAICIAVPMIVVLVLYRSENPTHKRIVKAIEIIFSALFLSFAIWLFFFGKLHISHILK